MTLAEGRPRGLAATRSLLAQLVAAPDLARTIAALPPQRFAALVREVGLEDAGELVALATTEQLVRTFDEDLFANERPGEREAFDADRFVVWLEVLLEAGDAAAANRVAELDEDFVAHALSHVLLVLAEDDLRERLDDADAHAARRVDKGLESALTEDLDGYLLVATRHDGWDAALALVLALDRDHRALLVRLLERLARIGSAHLDDLDELATVLSEGASLAEDVEAAREARRAALGYVEPRDARAFLALAREAPGDAARDPLTRAYFRELARDARVEPAARAKPSAALPPLVREALDAPAALAAREAAPPTTAPAARAILDALHRLHGTSPSAFAARLEELAYLANVLVAGHTREGERLGPREAAEAALATVGYGAHLEARAGRPGRPGPVRADELAAILAERPADLLFRAARHDLAARGARGGAGAAPEALLRSPDALEAALARAAPARARRPRPRGPSTA